MEIITSNQLNGQMIEEDNVVQTTNTNFIEANTKKVTLEHLEKDCIIPVFAKDNEKMYFVKFQ